MIFNGPYKILFPVIYSDEICGKLSGQFYFQLIDDRPNIHPTADPPKCREFQVPTHNFFVDFKAAYGTMYRRELWRIMDEHRFPPKADHTYPANDERYVVQCTDLRRFVGIVWET